MAAGSRGRTEPSTVLYGGGGARPRRTDARALSWPLVSVRRDADSAATCGAAVCGIVAPPRPRSHRRAFGLTRFSLSCMAMGTRTPGCASLSSLPQSLPAPICSPPCPFVFFRCPRTIRPGRSHRAHAHGCFIPADTPQPPVCASPHPPATLTPTRHCPSLCRSAVSTAPSASPASSYNHFSSFLVSPW